MQIFEAIGLIIYLILTVILILRQIRINRAFKSRQIDAETHQRLLRRNLILLVIVLVFLLLFLYTPFKLIFI